MTDYLDEKIDISDPEIANGYDETTYWASRFGALLFDNLEIAGHRRILDVGCATGFPLFELANAHGPSSRLVGVDLWGGVLARAARKRTMYGLGGVVELLWADAGRLPLRDGSFDLIVSNLGINNFARPAEVVSECHRAARSGALLALTTNLRGHMAELYEVYRVTLTALGLTEALVRLEENEAHRGTKASVCGLLTEGGFESVRTVEDRFILRTADGSALLRHWLTRIGFLDGWRAVIDPAAELDVFAALEARLNERAAKEGSLAMTIPMLYVEARKP